MTEDLNLTADHPTHQRSLVASAAMLIIGMFNLWLGVQMLSGEMLSVVIGAILICGGAVATVRAVSNVARKMDVKNVIGDD